MMTFLKPIHEKIEYYENHPDEVDTILKEGTKKAKTTAEDTMKNVKKAININYFDE